ncbi:VOC family protein [Thermobifida cellulosilytica]|uniref:Glyoxalase n=1 Tax=Thermobifida cellulosilytica TB100 TaxID=665004 RepID=A0A147KIJ9_THECS|nr:VOC family protein [Thermobifida cellulosilytica]KUP97122.1 glyoxalase [Thermobifida cellulosilytica TB100]
MRSIIRTVTFDCADPYALAEFWARAVGGSPEAGSRPGDPEVYVDTPDGQPRLFFQRVPENKLAKNRVHLDLGPRGGGRDEEVARLVRLGATFVADFRRDDGSGFVVLADPEGNEFCVEAA